MNFKEQFTFFIRSFFLQTGWNYMKFQNLGFFFVMWPFLKHLYRNDRDALPSVLSRYLATFNTQPAIASFCFGVLAKQEEHIAQQLDSAQTTDHEVAALIALEHLHRRKA